MTVPPSGGRVGPSALGTACAITVIAGGVAVLRQAQEARSVRAGLRDATGPDRATGPVARHGPLARTVAAWSPSRPATRLGRAVAACWAAPLSAVGFAVALAGGRVPRRDVERDCWVARGVGGPSRAALGAVGAAANTIGRVVLVRGDAPTTALLDHEAVHVRQAERLGPLLPVAHALFGARYGYADNPLERAARTGARRASELRRARAAG